MRCVICAIVRTENRYLPDWISYHLALGFDHIFLYDNAFSDEEHVEECFCRCEQYRERVTVFPAYNIQGFQVSAYTEFYLNHQKEFDYVAFIDVDEFVTVEMNSSTATDSCNSISTFIGKLGYPDAISLNWMTYGDCGLLNDDGRPDYMRFTHPLPLNYSKDNMWGKQPFNGHVKTIYRTGLKIDTIRPHCSEGDYDLVNAIGNPIEKLSVQKDLCFTNCYVKHFITRSIKEYIDTKIARGCKVDGSKGGYPLSMFFAFNKPTIKKLSIYIHTCNLYPEQTPRTLRWWIKCWIKMWIINPLFLKNA